MKSIAVILAGLSISLTFCTESDEKSDYPVQPVPFTSVRLTDNFWAPRVEKNAEVTIPIAFSYCESTGRVKNFDIAAGLDTGKFLTIYPFDDSDVYKIIEGASYSLQTRPDAGLEAYLDTLITKIGNAQEKDGYLYTNRTIAERNGGKGLHEWASVNRWELDSVLSHELYNLGHLYEAAVAHYQATGKRNLLDIALKSADLVASDFGPQGVMVWPGHQVIEMGLVKLYRTTGEKKYLDLARFFLDIRGPGGRNYDQSHKRVIDQTEATGHSVRATYMYSGMADIAAIEKDEAYLNAITSIWEDIVYRKIYITGGIGATGGNEGFAESFVLPNLTAYCETCASIGNIFTNHRLFLLHADSKYIDILEKTLYNAMLSGVSLSGDRFFYPNPLESDGRHNRSEWFGCACCPSNVARFVPAIPGYIYGTRGNEIFVNLYISNEADITVGNERVRLIQETDYPWSGNVRISVEPGNNSRFLLSLRIPGWARNEAIPGSLYRFADNEKSGFLLKVNGDTAVWTMNDGFACIDRKWRNGDIVELSIPMPVRKVVADERIRDDRGKVAIQRGPIMYCAEWPDNADGRVLNLVVDTLKPFVTEPSPLFTEGTLVIKGTAAQTRRTNDGTPAKLADQQLTLIPYAFWNNRGPGQMMVWLPVEPDKTKPLPASTIAYRSKLRVSRTTREMEAVRDQIVPEHSNDRSVPYYHWWPVTNQWEWVQYDFDRLRSIRKAKVYWFDDGPQGGCRIPDEWEMLYLSGNIWKPVVPRKGYTITKDSWDVIDFLPVTTNAVKLKVKLNRQFSAGIYEWVIE